VFGCLPLRGVTNREAWRKKEADTLVFVSFGQAIAICLGYLYCEHARVHYYISRERRELNLPYLSLCYCPPAPFAVNLITPINARPVLLASILLSLPDLSSLAYDLCRKSIQVDSVRSWIEWCDAREEQEIVSSRTAKRDGGDENEGSQEVGFGGIANYINGSLASAMGLSAGGRSGSITPSSEASVKAGVAWVNGSDEVQQDDWVGRLRSDV
jgi:hypothetical protein